MKEPAEIDLSEFRENDNTDNSTSASTDNTVDVLTEYERTPEPDPSDPDIMDIGMEELLDTRGTGQDLTLQAVDGMSLDQLMKAVFRRGSVMFDDGRMLTKCAGYGCPAMCGMYPLPHPSSGDPIMVCTGPMLAYYTKQGVFSSKECRGPLTPHDSCAYHPDRINEPQNNTVTVESDWL